MVSMFCRVKVYVWVNVDLCVGLNLWMGSIFMFWVKAYVWS